MENFSRFSPEMELTMRLKDQELLIPVETISVTAYLKKSVIELIMASFGKSSGQK